MGGRERKLKKISFPLVAHDNPLPVYRLLNAGVEHVVNDRWEGHRKPGIFPVLPYTNQLADCRLQSAVINKSILQPVIAAVVCISQYI